MLKTRIITLAVLAAFMITPAAVSAETPSVSYSAKKQGRVAFENKTEEQAAAEDVTNDTNPAEIEPAAGETVFEERNQDDSFANSMKLPRKN
jgi:preprotein translocase subunit SecF